jgi:excinuclease ABC subunit C
VGNHICGQSHQSAKTGGILFPATGRPQRENRPDGARVADIETVVTASEKEALILESNLIKRHRPRYNVVLKDDKRYPSIRIDINAPYPKIEIVRKTPKDGAVYFGPFSSAHAVRQTVKLINKTFPLRKCSDRTLSHRTRPCIHHQMGQCLAPCCLRSTQSIQRYC